MSKKLSLCTLVMFILGILTGLLLPQLSPHIAFLGTLYINLLKSMIIPILFFGIINAMAKNEVGKITIKTLIVFIGMFATSFFINSILVSILKPGVNASFMNIEWSNQLARISLGDFITSIIPSNILAAAENNEILPVILFAFAIGIAINQLELKNIAYIIQDCSKIFNKILEWIMYLTPIGVYSLMVNTTANYGISILKTASIYILTAWLGCLIVCALVMILPVWLYAKINPITYIKNVYEVWLITLSTCSSAATLPITIRTCNEKFNIPKAITDIVVPLGCTIHMCGGAVSFSLLALFNMQMYGIKLNIGLFLLMFILALIINMGAPGIPGGGVVIGATYLNILGIPIDFIGFYAGIYRLLDMAYTTMNVTGDISANILINKQNI